jgi:hypothetical protein
MKFLLTLFVIYLGYKLLKTYIAVRIAMKNDPRFNNTEEQGVSLEARPCPKCGLFTTTRCERPDCLQ